jgi:hypothetical protein
VPEHAPSLIAYINRWRREPIPADWSLGFFEYDWRIKPTAGQRRVGMALLAWLLAALQAAAGIGKLLDLPGFVAVLGEYG